MKTHIILLGAPGAGKGTQAKLIAKRLEVPHVSTGDILRAAVREGTELGRKASEYMEKGELVPDSVVVGLAGDRLKKDDAQRGFILDGFPRTRPQAEALDAFGVVLDAVVSIDVPDEPLVARITGRRSCPGCGAIFHVTAVPPKVEGVCDACDGKLIQRPDDQEATVRERLRVYHAQTDGPLRAYYGDKGLLVCVPGEGAPDDVFDRVLGALSE